jgi:hypothetical protein
MKILHAVFALVAALMLAGIATNAWSDGPVASFVMILFVTFFCWYTTWLNLAEVRKDELLEQVDAIDEKAIDEDDDTAPEQVEAQSSNNDMTGTADEIQAGLPKRPGGKRSSDIRRW